MASERSEGGVAVGEDVLRHVKPAVRALKAYTLAARPAQVKINQNENPWDLAAEVKRRVLERAATRPWSRYPEFDPAALLERLAKFAGWKADGVLAGNGSNELIEALFLVTVGQGAKVVIPEPTFTLYALLTTLLGGEAVRVRLRPDLSYDADAILRAGRESNANLTIVCSPNNPTGGVLEPAEIRRLCRESPGLVVVDEAYHEFAGVSAVPLLADCPNLVVLRTFSKAMALAGLRVGYLLAAPELVREINKGRLPYNLNFFSETAAIAALDAWSDLRETVERLVAERERLLPLLADMPGIRVHASRANFFLVEFDEADPKAVFEALYRRGVLVRDVTAYPMLSRCLRVTVGSPEENEAFLHALGAALGEAGPDRALGRA